MANYQAARARRVDRDFRYHPEASEDLLIHFLILPSSFVPHRCDHNKREQDNEHFNPEERSPITDEGASGAC